MTTQHSVQMQRSPHYWAEMYARFYGELSHYVESFLDDTVDLDSFRALYTDATQRHYDEIRGEVDRAIAPLREKPPE